MNWSLLVGALLLCAAKGWAQTVSPDEYVLPDFGPPRPPPSVPAPPPTPPPLLSPPPPAPPMKRPVAVAEQPPFWSPIPLGLAGVALFGRTFFYGGEAWVLGRIGTIGPRGSMRREVGGWVVEPGGELGYGRLNGPVCLGASVACGSRFIGGATVRVGWAQGFAPPSGETSPAQLFFGQLSLLGGVTTVPDAPLQRGVTWGELIIRVRAGVLWSLGRTSRFAVVGALMVELIPIGAQSQGIMGGVSLGVAF